MVYKEFEGWKITRGEQFVEQRPVLGHFVLLFRDGLDSRKIFHFVFVCGVT